jgi:5-methylcytosine-specific restriction endonuclease McrA
MRKNIPTDPIQYVENYARYLKYTDPTKLKIIPSPPIKKPVKVDKKLKVSLPEGFKKCSKCNKIKPTECFSKCKSTKSGFNSHCKQCHKEYDRKYNDTHRNERTVYKKMWGVLNPDKIRAQIKRYAQTSKGKFAFSKAIYNYKSRVSNLECTLTLEEWNNIIKKQKNKCARCGKNFTKSRAPAKDHIIPASKGGGLTRENVQALCKSCNSKKRDTLDHELIVTWINSHKK